MENHLYVGGDHYGYVKRKHDGKIIFGGTKADCENVMREIGEGMPDEAPPQEKVKKPRKPRKAKEIPEPDPAQEIA